MAVDQTLTNLGSGFYELCLSWVDRVLNVPGWGGLSASAAYQSFKGTTQSTSQPLKGDVALFGSNSGSGAGHAGICAIDGCGLVISDLPGAGQTGQLQLTDLNTLISKYEGGTSPIFVQTNTIGPSAGAAANGVLQTYASQISDALNSIASNPGGNVPQPPSFPPGTTTPVTFQPSPGSPVTVTGPTVPSGSGVSGSCSKPTAFNIGFPGGNASNIADWLGYFGCVSSYWLARVGLALAAGALVIVGIWIYSQDKDAPGAQGLQALAKRAPAVPGPAFAERTAAKEVRASSAPQGKHVSLETMEKRAKAHSDANALGVRLNSAAVNRHAGSIW